MGKGLKQLIYWCVSSTAVALVALPAQAENTDLEEIVVTGTRFEARSALKSPTPIDSISAEDLTRGGGSSLQDMLKVAVPSFSTPRPVAAGSLDFITPPTMRGLSTGQLLLLIDGKRRHTSPDLNSSNQVGRGDVAYDFNSIPTAAIERVEVLRDGAAAQYGSDAIAGVLNIQLARGTEGVATAKFGMTQQGDGADTQVSVAKGVTLGNDGFVRLTAQYQAHQPSNRATADTRQQYFGIGANGALVAPSANYGSGTGLTASNGTLDPREATIDRDIWKFGDPKYRNAAVFVNAEKPLSDLVEAYAFGGYNRLEGISYNFFRRAGQDETVRSIYPNGFLPLQNITLQNGSGAFGLKGDDLAGFGWDLSTLYGGGRNDLGYSNSNNVSQGASSQTSFDRGNDEFRQWTTNLDLTRRVPLGFEDPLKVAFGLEYRKEFYDLRAGEPASYANGGLTILDGPNKGKPAPVGAQPGGGITPDDAVSANRDSKAAYLELEHDFFDKRLTLSSALRYEDFSDFGDTTNYKVAGRFALTDELAFRSSYGTGFRAPALAQSYFGSTNISFVNGQPLRIRTISVNDPIASLVGASALKPEKSDDISAGFVFTKGALEATVDAYQIKITDRIAMSSNFQSTALTNLLASKGYANIGAVAYLTNAVDTTTRGVDVTLRYRQDLQEWGVLTGTLAGTYNNTTFDRIAGTPAALSAIGITTVLFDLSQQVRFTSSTPKEKETLNLNWQKDRLKLNLTLTRYGEVGQVALTGKTPAQVAALIPGYKVKLVPSAPGSANSDIIQYFGADIVTDIEGSYDVTSDFTITAGISNLLDQYPDKQIASTAASVAAGTNGADNNGTFPYAYIAPYGVNGRTFYVKAAYRF
ncbi:TonB-dependent receptor [Nitrospirillum amazonense]|uniref:TonB-dependent receptor plug domain-containing protein n=1 Tax=Nitrospirillum amazonense TaxID=28077 RepID=UPI002DD441E9|nr:TonB-dependent receptor [Nitrospirillum amazonense]MEC4589669.1 TonB-dependent receptor [Nitrospirillum amazonense]